MILTHRCAQCKTVKGRLFSRQGYGGLSFCSKDCFFAFTRTVNGKACREQILAKEGRFPRRDDISQIFNSPFRDVVHDKRSYLTVPSRGIM